MARKILLDTQYTFTPSTKTLVLNNRYIPQERLLLITNVTQNKVIFNFSDPSLKATSYTTNMSGATGTTTIVLNYNTSTMSATDKIQVTLDEYSEDMRPAEEQLDPVGKFRVSTPQSLIDTDFEYGTQVSKWENLALINNRPLGYQTVPNIGNLSSMTISTGSRTVTVTTSTPHFMSAGTPIVVQDTYLSIANGNYIVDTVADSTHFTYTARAANSTTITSVLDANKTAIYAGAFYSGSQIGTAPTISTISSGNGMTITTTVNHGLAIGNEIAITGITSSTGYVPNGAFVVATINSPTSFNVYTPSTITGTLTTTSAAIYVRPQGQFLHRPFDGGVIFSSNGSSNFESAIRQTRRYFRYQSGKGIQMSTGTIIKPNLTVDSITSSGTAVTVQTKEQHNLQVGTTVTIYGANETSYNGTFTVTGVTGYNTFTYTALSVPAASPASGTYFVQVTGWYGAKNRMGLFDTQNGVYWQFDGQTLSVVRRNSVFQLAGKVSATNGSHSVTQTNSSFPTTFSKQLIPGDYIVIRGQSYRVTDILSDTTINISPAYRGTTDNYIICSKTIETVIPQSSFNIDKLDGTGPSGYNIDLSKMQMWYIDFSWYGAGFVRYGVRATDGNIVYAHKMPNNNVNSEAYMRSGNIPGRYESSTLPPATYLTSAVGSADTSINVASTSGFPSSGTLVIRGNAGSSNTSYEYINYTGTTSTTFTGLTRGQAGNSSLALTVAIGSNMASVSSSSGLQVGQRIIAPLSFPDGTFIAGISGTTLTLSQGALTTNPTVIAAPMGATSGQAYTYTASAPNAVEFAYPTYAPTISHWGTAAIMDGGFTPDKSLLFTYGQQTPVSIPASLLTFAGSASGSSGSNTITLSGTGANTTANVLPGMIVSGTNIAAGTYVTSVVNTTNFTISPNPTGTISSGTLTLTGNNTRALLSIRLAPSVDNGIGAGFGQRDLLNRAQLILSTLDVSLLNTQTGNILVRGYINAQPFGGSQTVFGNTQGASIYLSTASGTGSVVTYTTTTPHGLNTTDQVVISGVTSSTGYNGTYTITSVPSSTTFTVASTYSTSYSTTGSPSVFAYKQWTNAVGNVYGSLTSSLAQIADYSPNATNGGNAGAYSVTGGEVTGGFFANQTTELDLSSLRDLGNAVLGGGGLGTPAYAGQNGYPDGPDVLTIVVTNLSSAPAQVIGRIAWTEAQA